MEIIGHQHTTAEWRLFAGSSEFIFNVITFHNKNTYPSKPEVLAVCLKSHKTMKLLLKLLAIKNIPGVFVVTWK
jgi:hypothetical protein